MHRFYILLLIGLHFTSSAVAAEDTSLPKRPNIIMIVIDDLGYGDLGCYGSQIHQTPHIDRLASGGMLFTDFHANAPVCSPTRAAIMTGQYQQRSGIEYAIPFTHELGMPLEKFTISEALKQAGYTCGLMGKWHLGHVSRFGPNDQGFDESWCSNNTPDYHTHVSRIGELDWYHNHQIDREPGYLTDLVSQHSCDFIRDNVDRPFFLVISHLALHFPFQGPNDPPLRTEGKIWHDQKHGPLNKREYRRAYRDMLVAVDKSVGKVMDTLNSSGLQNDTIIFLLSDNGAYSWVGSNGSLRGQKGDLFEGGHRVPAVAYWPGQIPAASKNHQTIMTMDLMPTILSLAGLPLPTGLELDGLDLKSTLLRNAPLPDRTLFWRFNNLYTKTNASAVREGKWKLIEQGTEVSLYDLESDLSESQNLASQHPDVAKALQAKFFQWNRPFRDLPASQ
ncbi:sulfatase [Blastopirellula sp. J2-11]|uniref:sulfatase n=1 Tax=Blastopirellula sp. J2-11 TaxID=2943192 RepID=UPI0021CA6C18|nr:sulfatase [Blastopirellula sp. J2-11]UUO07753.1 sulfatase [Blastopirellula sp. J2-11]